MQKLKSPTSQRARELYAQRAFLFFGFVILAACAPSPKSQEAEQLAQSTIETLGCTSELTDKLYSNLYDSTLSGAPYVPGEAYRAQLEENLNTGRLKPLSLRDREILVSEAAALYSLLTTEASRLANTDRAMEFLGAMEMGDVSTTEYRNLQTEIKRHLKRIENLLAPYHLPACIRTQVSSFPTPPPSPIFAGLETARHPVVAGGVKAFAVAYQSCDVAFSRALGPETPDVRGIQITGDWPNSPGRKREISNLSELLASHPYLAQYRKPKASCFDVRGRPMIYDFGGKPVALAKSLDFFKNSGGTKVLGIDCSGYVFSALATAGLRLSKGVRIKTALVGHTPAAKWMKPQATGLTCFHPISFQAEKTIVPGDILASGGHIMIIESVGADPFGIAGLTKESDCTIDRMSADRFDMTFLQSGSAKGGLGISRIRPAKFLPEDEAAMDAGLKEYAVAACRARIRGSKITAQPSSATLVRHSGTSDCVDTKIQLAHEDCVADCQAL